MALQADGKIVAVGVATRTPATSRSPATTRTARSTRASPATASRRPTSGASTRRAGWRSRATARSSRSARRAGGDFALARYNPNGSLDTSFSGDGKQTTDFGGSDAGERGGAPGRRQDRRGRRGGAGGDFALARYNPNGSLDTSFSGDGKQTTDFGGFDGANGVALQGDGKIVAVGVGGASDDFALARYNPNGSLDTSFSGDGKQTTDFGGSDQANGVALQGDGKIVAVGVGLGTDGTNDFALARYLGG